MTQRKERNDQIHKKRLHKLRTELFYYRQVKVRQVLTWIDDVISGKETDIIGNNKCQDEYDDIIFIGNVFRCENLVGHKEDSKNSKGELKIPKQEFRRYGGDLKGWLDFWNKFSRIDEDSDLEKGGKFQYPIQTTTPSSRARQIVALQQKTVLGDCEVVSNVQPLSNMSEDPNDSIVLTPAMFLQDIEEVGVAYIDLVVAQDLTKHYIYRLKLKGDLNERFWNI
ncbi:hypothetical protein JTB14_022240 [Gonioctena quinquepunctata]|nr:hypothetical protein JTB14_022240 [Gonioctena quinquepunctata]